jgi:preprotein translocase subunit SecE
MNAEVSDQSDAPTKSSFVMVLVVEAAIIVLLWGLARLYGYR